MIVLGIDPGTANTGYGVIESDGREARAIVHGTLVTVPADDVATRLAQIQQAISEVIDAHRPDAVALESLFIGANPRAILSVGQARGVILASCGQRGITSAEYAPAEIKSAVCGNGRADKRQMTRVVSLTLALREQPGTDHAADALAVALCHAWSARARSRIAGATR